MEALETLEMSVGELANGRPLLQDIPDNEMAKRGVEVALAGGHGIAFIYQGGAPGREMLSAVQGMALDAGIPFTGLAALPCPCGCFGTATQRCTCSLKRIIAYRKKLARRTIGCDMAVEVLPPWGKSVRRGEPEEKIMARVRRARAFAGLTDASLSRDCEDFLALYRREVSTIRMAEIKSIAATACRLEGSTRIQPCQIMEATMYQHLWQDLHRLLCPRDTGRVSRNGA